MKHRQFSIVVHNVRENIQDKVKEYHAQNVKEYVMSVEPYPQGGGFHLHVFLHYPNQRSFKSVIREYEKLAKTLMAPKPPGEERSWGRVQVDVMRGRFDQCRAYLEGQTKDKPTGEVVHLVAGQLPQYWSKYHEGMWSQFIDWCEMSQDDYRQKYEKVGELQESFHESQEKKISWYDISNGD